MKYFLLKNATMRKEIGCFPQCEGVPDGYNFGMYDKSNSITNLNNDTFPDFDPEIIVQLDRKAKLTDVVSHTNFHCRGLFVNEKVKSILEQFNLPEHKFFEGILIYQDKKIPYYWFHLVKKDLQGINFAQSEFRTGFSPNNLDDEILQINTLEDFNNIIENNPKFVGGAKIILEEEYQKFNLDLIYFPFIHFYIFISENVANLLIKEKVSGIEIIEQKFL